MPHHPPPNLAAALDLLACPACLAPLRPDQPPATITCTQCHRVYPVIDGIPILLIDRSHLP